MRLIGHNQPLNEITCELQPAGNHVQSLTVSDGRRFVTLAPVEFCMDEVSSDK